jgi:conjugal transfer/entry exclusion protein
MRIEKNKEKLERWLKAEERKLTKINGRLIPNNNLRTTLNKISSHTFLIKESKKRFGDSAYKAKLGQNWKNNNSSNWNGNFNGLANPEPLILVTNNGRYLGHVWVNGVKVPKRPTGHFQGIQKTVNLNKNLVKAMKSNNLIRNRIEVTPYLMKAVENHLRNLGYRAMSTYWPMGKMLNMLNKSPNWKQTSNLVFKKNIAQPPRSRSSRPN